MIVYLRMKFLVSSNKRCTVAYKQSFSCKINCTEVKQTAAQLHIVSSLAGRLSADGRTSWRNMSLRGTSSTAGRSSVTRQTPKYTTSSSSAQMSARSTAPSARQATVSQPTPTPRCQGPAVSCERERSRLPKKSQSQRE